MILAILLLTAAGGAAAAALGMARGELAARIGAVLGIVALIAVLGIALALDAPAASESVTRATTSMFGGRIVRTDYLRLVVALWAFDGILVVLVAWLLGGLAGLRGLLAGTLAAIAGGLVALGATDLALGVVAAAATGLASLVVVLTARRPSVVAAAARELRVTLGVGALVLAAVAVAPIAGALALPGGPTGPSGAPGTNQAGAVLGIAALAVALGVGVRLGSIPFHLRIPRLSDASAPAAMPLLAAWVPLPLAVSGLAVMDYLVAPLALPLDAERWLIVGFAVLTLTAAALAAFIADDLRHAVGYLVIADGGVVLLGIAAMDPAAWGPTRIWVVALAASKTALAAWSAVAEARFETRSLPDLRGWIRPAPILAAAFVIATVATFGLPGWLVFTARGDLGVLAGGGTGDALLILAGFLTLPTYLRVLAIGTGPASSRVARAAPERFVRPARGPRRAATPDAATPDAAPERKVGTTRSETPELQGGRAGRGIQAAAALGRLASAGGRIGDFVRRDRTELTSAAVLALAILAALTSWGALDLGSAAREPAPIVSGPAGD